jgi:zinc/manganese transport system substrate-binding protein
MLKQTLATLLLLLALPAAAAELKIVATSSAGGSLVRELAADRAVITVLAPPDRDLHTLQVRPSMMRALRGADLVVAMGADLEVGWLPLALQQSANPRILPGRPGYFESAAQVELAGGIGIADRALGDVHPLGNPHVNMDPVRWIVVAEALAQRLGELDPGGAEMFTRRARDFGNRVRARLTRWQTQLAGAGGAVLFHEDATYLLERFSVPLLGLLEPVPGVPPTAAHLRDLTRRLEDRHGIIVHAPFQSAKIPQRLAGSLNWPVARLALDPPLDADGEGYLRHMDAWIAALAESAR